MGQLIQQVNLYQPIFRREKPPLGARSLGVLLVIAVLVMLAATITGHYQLRELERQTAGLDLQQQELQTRLDAIRADLKPRQRNQLLVAEQQQLESDLRNARRLARLLALEFQQLGQPYSAFFRGLAEAPVDGLWLQQLHIQKGGEVMSLAGQALRPELIPRLLQSLKRQAAFAGRSFGKVQIQREEKQGIQEPVRFQLQTVATPEEQQDAG